VYMYMYMYMYIQRFYLTPPCTLNTLKHSQMCGGRADGPVLRCLRLEPPRQSVSSLNQQELPVIVPHLQPDVCRPVRACPHSCPWTAFGIKCVPGR
jgi:hypothetical protein